MDLEIHLVADALQRLAVGGKDGGMSAGHVEIVDAAFIGGPNRGDDFLLRLRADNGRAHADDADLFPAMGQNTILHMKAPLH